MESRVDLPPPPADLAACFAPGTLVPRPAAGKMTERQVVALIGSLKKSELAHHRCGARVIGWYEKIAAGYASSGKK